MAVINLICMLSMTVMLAFFMGVHQYGTFQIDRENKIPEEKLKQANRDSNKLFAAKIVALIIVSVSVILFFTKENLSESLIVYNEYTAVHCILTVLFFVIFIFGNQEVKKAGSTKKERKSSDSDRFFLE